VFPERSLSFLIQGVCVRGIFISYRKDDSRAWAGRLADSIAHILGPGIPIFRDVEDIGAGVNWLQSIQTALNEADVFLVLIGPKWLNASGLNGSRRLDDDTDIHRLEIEAALARNLLVVPVLMDGATPPDPKLLPESLRPLLARQCMAISDENWDLQCQKLCKAFGHEELSESVAPENSPYKYQVATEASPVGANASRKERSSSAWKYWVGGAAVVGVCGYGYWLVAPGTPSKTTVSVPKVVMTEAEQQAVRSRTIQDKEYQSQIARAEAEKAKAEADKKEAEARIKGLTHPDQKGAPSVRETNTAKAPAKVEKVDQTKAPPTSLSIGELERRSKLGDLDAKLVLGVARMKAGRASDAIALWEEAAKGGNAHASFELGNVHLSGQGAEKSLKMAVQNFQLAAERGSAAASRQLGLMYLDGTAVPKDKNKAMELLKTAARQGDLLAKKQLGEMKVLY
jgi:hypothetical protein